MGYSPGLSKGQPGQIHIHKEASISGWEHEFRHFLDDEAKGFLGMESLWNVNYQVGTELNAYSLEVNFVKSLKGNNTKAIKQLKINFEKEIKAITEYGNISDKELIKKISKFLK